MWNWFATRQHQEVFSNDEKLPAAVARIPADERMVPVAVKEQIELVSLKE